MEVEAVDDDTRMVAVRVGDYAPFSSSPSVVVAYAHGHHRGPTSTLPAPKRMRIAAAPSDYPFHQLQLRKPRVTLPCWAACM